jgi:hypothetical protein
MIYQFKIIKGKIMTPKKPSLKDIENFAKKTTENKKNEIKNPEEKTLAEIPVKKSEQKNKKQNTNAGKIGRPALKPDRKAKVYFYTTQEIKNRIDTAFLKEKIKQTEKGKKFDKSLFIENAIINYLKKNSY